MAQVLITGGTGLIGSLLCSMLLKRGDEVVVLSTKRQTPQPLEGVRYIYWNPAEKIIDPAFSTDNCTIINLAGESVAGKRWTADRKKAILESRLLSLQTLFEAVQKQQIGARFLLSTSAIGYYGSADKTLTENDAAGSGFLAETCVQWEAAARQFQSPGLSVAIARIGIVLSRQGGALKELIAPLQFGVAGIPGKGRQIMSWIHHEDVCRMMLFLIDRQLSGVYNAVADQPVSANTLFEAILKVKKGLQMNIPEWMLRLIMGEMYQEIIKSAAVSNAKIKAATFECKYPSIDHAIDALLSQNK